MKSLALLWCCLFLPACALFQRPFRPAHAPAEEAARFQFPLELPAAGRMHLPGTMAAAIELAMDDFLPRDVKPHKGATQDEVCLYKRDSYDVMAAPASGGVVLVNIYARGGACNSEGPVLDMGATYAVDVSQWRILAIQR